MSIPVLETRQYIWCQYLRFTNSIEEWHCSHGRCTIEESTKTRLWRYPSFFSTASTWPAPIEQYQQRHPLLQENIWNPNFFWVLNFRKQIIPTSDSPRNNTAPLLLNYLQSRLILPIIAGTPKPQKILENSSQTPKSAKIYRFITLPRTLQRATAELWELSTISDDVNITASTQRKSQLQPFRGNIQDMPALMKRFHIHAFHILVDHPLGSSYHNPITTRDYDKRL